MDRTTRARWLAWISCVCLSIAVYVAIASVWLPVMSIALTLASLGLALMLAAVALVVVDQRGRRREGAPDPGERPSGS